MNAELNAARSAMERLRGWTRCAFDALYSTKPNDGTDAGKLRALADALDVIDNATDTYYGASGPVSRTIQSDLRRIASTIEAAP